MNNYIENFYLIFVGESPVPESFVRAVERLSTYSKFYTILNRFLENPPKNFKNDYPDGNGADVAGMNTTEFEKYFPEKDQDDIEAFRIGIQKMAEGFERPPSIEKVQDIIFDSLNEFFVDNYQLPSVEKSWSDKRQLCIRILKECESDYNKYMQTMWEWVGMQIQPIQITSIDILPSSYCSLVTFTF